MKLYAQIVLITFGVYTIFKAKKQTKNKLLRIPIQKS